MSDFQNYLDHALRSVVFSTSEERQVSHEYDIFKELAQLIVESRDKLGISQKELAEKSGLTQANISKIESGGSHPTIDSLRKIADALDKRLSITFLDQEGDGIYD